MGKVFDALEKHKRGELIKPNTPPLSSPQDSVNNLSETPVASDVAIQMGFSPKVLVTSAPNSVEAEGFKVLRARILFPKDGRNTRTIMVTSTFPGEGKTFVAANLAASIAIGVNQHVLLVDCDFRRPNLHNMLGCSNAAGLYEYLDGRSMLPELLIRTRLEKLSLLTAGNPGSSLSELLSSTTMSDFLEEAKARYQDRYIIVDSPPSHVTAEVGVLSHHVDAIIYVVMAQKTPRQTIQRNIEDLGREKILGIVFNGYRQSYKPYYKYYKKYYQDE